MATKRRTRFTVTVERNAKVEKKVILAYTESEAFQYYSLRGYRVGRVTRGDYRKQDRLAQTKASAGFQVDQDALRDACDLLGLKIPVRVRFNARDGSTNGNYRFQGSYHDIMLKSYRTAEQASSTLWHELTHAMQTERAGATWVAWQTLLESERGQYKHAPTEIEAREMSATMSDVLLCR